FFLPLLISDSTATSFDQSLWVKQTHQTQRFSHGDFSSGFPLISEECFGLMIKREFEHLPRDDYYKRLKSGELDFNGRSEAVHWIWKVHVYYNFGPLSAYLSVNYLDMFLSTYELPRGKAWIMQLLAVACLSLAAKMEEIEVPLPVDLQVEECKFIFEAKTIPRMELLVLSTLKWRMCCDTFHFHGLLLFKSLTNDVWEINIEIEYLEFKPSEVAAAVSISVTRETNLDKYEPCFIKNVQKVNYLIKLMPLLLFLLLSLKYSYID
ncbi:hypothetical protein GIB67_007826, partial [Kingdonia uniflora]